MLKNILSTVFGLLVFGGLMFVILYGGPMLSRASGTHYKKAIDENGVIVKAVIYAKSTYKGKSIKYSYRYNGSDYSDYDQSDSLFHRFETGDTVYIKIDATHPGNSYVIDPAKEQ